jgi:hypothetical protein
MLILTGMKALYYSGGVNKIAPTQDTNEMGIHVVKGGVDFQARFSVHDNVD